MNGHAPARPTASSPHPDDLPDFFRFAPVPGKARHDGWSAGLQFRFILALARGAGVDAAARSLGRTRQSAYALRRRAGGEGFAAAWDSAAEFARQARGAAFAAGAFPGGIETLLVPRYYRGRLIGFVQRDGVNAVMARLARLDAMADRIDARRAAAQS